MVVSRAAVNVAACQGVQRVVFGMVGRYQGVQPTSEAACRRAHSNMQVR